MLLLLAPLTLGATDRVDDAIPCPRLPGASVGRGGSVPDLVDASGEIVELGTSLRFTLRFAEPLEVPDAEGKPFRIDIVIADPDAPPVDAGLYRGVNRLVRYDAVAEPVTTILLLPEGGQSRFLAPQIDGAGFVVQVPGRTLTADEDDTGTSPGLERLRWGVIVRDEGECDLLGSGRPDARLVVGPDAASEASGGPSSVRDEPAPTSWLPFAAGLSVAILAAGYVVVRRRRPR